MTRSQPKTSPGKEGWRAAAFGALFLTAISGAVAVALLPMALVVVYWVASIVTFIAYARDKFAARNGQWRTRENALHLLGLVGGWPGALFAQKLFRHKSRKREFLLVFWITVAVNCCGMALLVAALVI